MMDYAAAVIACERDRASMSMLIASFMFVPLLAVFFAHLLWAMGRSWPIHDRKLLAETVIGTPGIESVPRLPALIVAIGILAAGIVALALADHTSGGIGLSILGIICAAIFLSRGFAGYTAGWAEKTPNPNFRLNDRRVYSPLCLFLGAGFLALVVMRLV